MKKIFSIITVIVLAITLVSCGGETREGVLIVGLEADYPPFNWLETRANDYNYPLDNMPGSFAAGYDVEVAKHIADELGLELVIKAISWNALIQSLNGNDIDLIIAGMSPTADRMEQVDFTDAYYTAKHVAVVLKDGPLANATALADFATFTGIGQLETTYEDIVNWLADNHNTNVAPSLDSVPEIVATIVGGDADFTILEEPVANGLIANNPNFKILFADDETNIFEVSEEDRVVSIALRKNSNDLLTNINAILNALTVEQRNTWMDLSIGRSDS